MAHLNNDDTFSGRRHCSLAIQGRLQMYGPNVTVPREGDRSATGQHGPSIMSANTYGAGFPQESARICWDGLREDWLHHPQSAEEAVAYFRLAKFAGVDSIPEAVTQYLSNNDIPRPPTVVWDISPGVPKFTTETDSKRFIAFLASNMDPAHAVQVPDMTLREIWEWFEAYVRCGRTHQRRADETRGLRGTDMGAITNNDQLRAAIARSPTASRRRPANHAIAEDDWNRISQADPVARLLNF